MKLRVINGIVVKDRWRSRDLTDKGETPSVNENSPVPVLPDNDDPVTGPVVEEPNSNKSNSTGPQVRPESNSNSSTAPRTPESIGKTQRKSRRVKKLIQDSPNKCVYCQRSFTARGLAVHIYHWKNRGLLSGEASDKVQCDCCGRSFCGARGLKLHKTKSMCGRRNSPEESSVLPSNTESEVLASHGEPHSASPHHLKPGVL